jgi:hypothetical protein
MKRVDLIKAIEASGCVLVRHGGRHDWYPFGALTTRWMERFVRSGYA